MKRAMALMIASALFQFGCGGSDTTSTSDEGPGPFATAQYALANNGGIVAVTASSAQSGYPASSAVDGNFATRWSAQGQGEWLAADLGAVQNVQGLQVAWYRGSMRQYYFAIAVSTDGTNYSTVYSGTSSGTTLQFEPYTFASVSARYVKLTVNGNNKNSWDAVTELAVTLAPGSTPTATPVMVAVTPQAASASAGATAQFAATVTGSTNTAVSWSVQEGAAGGAIDATGLYTAPTTAGTYHVVATSQADATQSSSATVTVSAATTPTSTTPTSTTTTTTTPTPTTSAPLPAGVVAAFPGASGGGGLSAGGRGGAVFKVTNLNDSGTGSLRACVQASGPRTCVFTVAGVITLNSALYVSNPYLTIAGQTAPGDGVALELGTPGMSTSNLGIVISTHDVVVRYIRMWGNWVANQDPNTNPGTRCFTTDGAGANFIADHVNCLWTSSMDFSAWHAAGKTTFQWSLWGENLLNSGSGAGVQAVSMLFAPGSSTGDYEPNQAGDFDLHHNVIATASHRNPEIAGQGIRVVNNLIHNWHRASIVDSGGSTNPYGQSVVDFVGNYFKPGPFSKETQSGYGYAEIMADRGVASLYLAGNKSDWSGPVELASRGPVSSTGNQWSLTGGNLSIYQGPDTSSLDPLTSIYQRSNPLCALGSSSGCTSIGSPGPAIPVDSADNLQALLTASGSGVGVSRMLNCDGTWRTVSDNSRDRILAYVVAGSGPSAEPSTATGANGGALPSLASGTACVDSDGDGIPDAYEIAHGLNPNSAADGPLVQADGYSNLEHFLNGN